MNETKHTDALLTILTTDREVWVLNAMGLSEKLDDMHLRSIHPEGMMEEAFTRGSYPLWINIAPYTVPEQVPYGLPKASHTTA